MIQNIVILNGSPRSAGNTAMLCQAFTEGAQAAGHAVTRFDLGKMNIHGCLGCMKGGKDPSSPCVQKDDMDKIYKAYQEADILVLASPMYFWSISAQLKTAFDRLFAVAELDSNYQNPKKDVILLMPAEGDSPDNWKPVLDYYHAILQQLSWNNRGTVLAGGVMKPGDILGKPALEEARQLGASLS